jgi:DNA-binding MarR family transcriptional regulator
MKLLEHDSNPSISADECAGLVKDTVPLVMRTIRAEMRSHRSLDLSVPQFRALAFLGRQPGASLSDVAAHIGLTLPSISKMIDRLVARDLVMRRSAPEDRRRMCLELTPLGEATLQVAAKATRDRLAERLATLSPDERAAIIQAMRSLHMLFGSEQAFKDDSRT